LGGGLDGHENRRGHRVRCVKVRRTIQVGVFGSSDPCLASTYPKVYEINGGILKLGGLINDEIEESTDVLIASRLPELNGSSNQRLENSDLIARQHQGYKMWGHQEGAKYPPTGEDSLEAVLATIFMGNLPEQLRSTKAKNFFKGYFSMAAQLSSLENSWVG